MPPAPPHESEFIDRVAGRAIVLDPDDRTLMIRGEDPQDPSRGGFWWTPGGGLDDGEPLDVGTRRELWEELGLHVDELGPIVMRRIGEFPLDGRWYRQAESFFIVTLASPFTPKPQHWEEIEKNAITELRWLSCEELATLDEPYYPRRLVELISYFLSHGPPSEPWLEEQRA